MSEGRFNAAVAAATTALAVVGALVTASSAATMRQPALRWKYADASELVYRMTNRTESELPAQQGRSVSASEQTHTMRWSVLEVAPTGDATVRVLTERIQVKMEGPTLSVTYDSDSGEAPEKPQARVLAAMVGTSYTLVIGPDGTVKEVQGVAETRDRILGALAPEVSDVGEAMLGWMFNDEAMASTIQQGIQMFPAEPIRIGDSWKQSFAVVIPMLGTMTTNLDSTLEGIEPRDGGAVARVSTTGEILYADDPDRRLAGMLTLGSASMTGTFEFDVDRGVTLSSNMATTMEMTLTAGGQEMTLSNRATTSLELIEYVPRQGAGAPASTPLR